MKNEEELLYRFCVQIIARIHIDQKDFFKAVKHQKKYETLICSWIIRLFEKGKTIEESIAIISRARYLIYIRNKKKGL